MRASVSAAQPAMRQDVGICKKGISPPRGRIAEGSASAQSADPATRLAAPLGGGFTGRGKMRPDRIHQRRHSSFGRTHRRRVGEPPFRPSFWSMQYLRAANRQETCPPVHHCGAGDFDGLPPPWTAGIDRPPLSAAGGRELNQGRSIPGRSGASGYRPYRRGLGLLNPLDERTGTLQGNGFAWYRPE